MKKLLCVYVITVVLGWVGSTWAQGPLLQRGTKEEDVVSILVGSEEYFAKV